MAMTTRKDQTINQYLYEEGLLALEPLYKERQGSTRVHTTRAIHHDPRSVPGLIKRLASYHCMSLERMRGHYSKLLDKRSYVPLPLGANLVLLPVVFRRSEITGETTTGYINLPRVEQILPPPEPEKQQADPPLSRVQFQGGYQLNTLNTQRTLRERMRQGWQALEDYQSRHYQPQAKHGLRRELVLEALPDCDCVLRDIFRGMITR